MTPRKRLFPKDKLRSRASLLLAVPLLAVALGVGACTPPSTSPSGTTTTTTTTTTTVPDPTGPTITGEACQPDSGVTVVVDFTALDDSIRIACAPGEQANGFAALAATGFVVGDEAGPGTVCTIDSLPTEGYPFCWLEGGYWSYWKSPNRSSAWGFSLDGAGFGPIPDGSVEGWSWAPAFDGSAPRVSVADLGDYTPGAPMPVCAVPDAPVLSLIAETETLPFTIPGDGPIEVSAIPATDDPSTAVYSTTDSLTLAGMTGSTRVLARSASTQCTVGDTFDAVYDVQPTYSGRPGIAGSTSPAVSKDNTSIIGWATGHSDYSPGADVAPSWQVPSNGYGPVDSSLLVLGNGGEITMTFDAPINNGAGADLAVFENGFYENNTSQNLFIELAYVEVSSNGTDFVRFDSATQWTTPIGSFAFADQRKFGGVAGKDGAGWGTPFDLDALGNKASVRSGLVDLNAITHVRLVDIVGANDYPNVGDTYPDSFGRQIFDTHKTVGSGGFDLSGIAVLN